MELESQRTAPFLVEDEGCNDIGSFVCSSELARAGAHVVLAVRNTAAGQELVHKWVTDQKIEGGPSINAEVI